MGTLVALDDVSLELAPGEILGVVGESGAGKSMTGAAVMQLCRRPPGLLPARSCSKGGGSTIFRGGNGQDSRPQDRRDFPRPADQPHPLFTIGDQIEETIRTHLRVGAAEARERALNLLRRWAYRRRPSA